MLLRILPPAYPEPDAMGRYYDQIASYPMLAAGWARVEESDGAAGADGISIYQFGLRLDAELDTLERELRRRTYTPQPLLRVEIAKKSGGVRVLGIPAVRDRVAQGAALAVLGPTIERELETTSFAYRPGRSHRDAIARIRLLRDQGYTWVVDADITKYFDNVDHALLLARLRELVPDDDVIRLVEQWVAAPMVPRAHAYPSEHIPRTKGLPQGAVISPALANLFLDRFDEALADEGYKLVRYADDFVILCKTRPRAEEAMRLTEALLNDLDLTLHPEKTRIASFDDGFKYLGALFVRSLIMPGSEAGQDLRIAKEHPVTPAAETPPPADPTATPTAAPAEAPAEAPTALGQALLDALRDEDLTLETLRRRLETNVGAMGVMPRQGPEAEPARAAPPAREDTPAAETTADAEEEAHHRAAPFLRTLYVHEQGCWLRKEGGRFLVSRDDVVLLEVPVIKIEQVVLFGSCIVSPAARRYCLKQEIPVFFLSTLGTYYGHLASDARVHLAREGLQYARAADPAFRLATARRLVAARLHNQRSLLQRYHQRTPGTSLAEAIDALRRLVQTLPQAATLDEARGYEGRGAAVFFGVFHALIRAEGFAFTKRTRRPPTDPVNSLLSLGYTLLYQNVRAMLHLHRLNPYLGNLHEGHDYHPALASDLIEEFRMLIEGLVLNMVNRRLVRPEDFYAGTPTESGAVPCWMRAEARKRFLRSFEDLMHRGVTHPGTGYKVPYRRCIDLQVQAYLRHLEGTTPYEPFLRR